jgi:site-specific recombinase XerD
MSRQLAAPSFAALVQDFFCQRLVQQQNASARTVESYRDTFCLLLGFLQQRRRKPPTALADLDAPTIAAFLDHLETERHNSVRTRNARLAAVRSFLKYAALRDPAALPTIQRVLAIPMKRFARPALCFLSKDEVTAILEAPDATTWSGQRDRVLFALLYNTGARVSEVIALHPADVALAPSRHVRVTGKGRKQRVIPLWESTAQCLREWMGRVGEGPQAWLFPNRDGQPLSRSGVEKRLREAARTAAGRCPGLKGKRVSPHTFRHTTAMHLLQSGVDISVIALWLGHERPATTHHYIEANLAMKEEALSKLDEVAPKEVRYRATDKLLQFLEGL